ncbi:MAG TPA: MFS transporter, partial [Nevskiaceae bacterium]|nr:MFS transporter [Nevskiaceae bacterium]
MKRPSSVGVASGPATQGQRRSAWWLIAGLLVLAFNLRLIFPSLAVLLPQITRAAGLSSAAAGYLTTLPVVCMGVFAPLAPLCARRVGLERTLLAVVALLACGTALRGLAGVGGLFIGTAVAGAAIAVANVLLPALVKRDFPAHVATMTAMYIVAMYVGASLVAAGTVPLLQRWHAHWPTGLALCALPAAIATLLWLPKLWRQGPSTVRALPRVRGLARDPLAWQVTFFMGLQSAMAYIAAGWVAPILQSRGLSPTQAGWITSVVMFATIAGGLSAP